MKDQNRSNDMVSEDLIAEDRKILKRLESGHIEEAVVDPIEDSADARYRYYHSLKYDVDSDKGLIYKDYDLISKQRHLVFTLLKQIGGNILKGRSVMNISFPVYVFEPSTLLHRFAGLYGYVPTLLQPIVKMKGPLDRMKGVLTWTVATMHLGIGQYKPFNPILGETLQLKMGDMFVYGEQICHHPPISSIMVAGEGIKVFGTHEIEATTYPNSAQAVTNGKRTIKIEGKHPAEYVLSHPETEINGLMLGKRTFKYKGFITIEDKTNKLYGLICIRPDKSGYFSKKKHKKNYVKGFITKDRNYIKNPNNSSFDKKNHLSVCEGYWINEFSIDGEVVWKIEDIQPVDMVSPDDKLPSDSSLRPDLKALRNKDEKESQILKDQLEDVQRNDKKLREKFVKKK